ncbi:hypothetical protein [Scytonema sp. NUACC26]|uniref:hypothetical protein n=1 Tax=Scytonema sp. NUACC26 TaxID=3140176 RepID=UPI0034DBB9B0
MHIQYKELNEYSECMNGVASKIRTLRSSVPIIQNELNNKFPQATLEVSAGLVPLQVIPKNKEIKKILSFNEAVVSKQVKLHVQPSVVKKYNKIPITKLSKDIVEATIKHILTK